MLSDRNALRVVLARFISRTGGEAAFFVGIWGKAAFEFQADPAGLALLMAGLGVAGLVGSAAAGVLIDRFGPKRVLVGGELLFVPVALGVLWADSLTSLTVLALLIGLFGTPLYTAIASFPPFITRDETRLARVNAAVETAGMAALISGTAIGALLARFVGIDAIFVFDAATSLVGAALVLGVTLRPLQRVREERRGSWAEAREGIGYVYRHRRLRFYVLMGTATWLLFGLFSALEPLFYRDVLGTGPEALGWVNTIFGCGLVAGTLVAGRLPAGASGARAVATLLALNGVGSLIYVGTDRLAVVVVGAVVWGTVIGMFFPLVRTMIHLNSPEELIGRIMGTSQMHSELARLVPLAFAPALAAAFGVQPTLAWSGLLVGSLGLVVWQEATHLDRTRRVREVPPEPPSVADEPISPVP